MSIFRFKDFAIAHNKSSMKVGVDGVLLGAWVSTCINDTKPVRILDVGCGCGLISLILTDLLPNSLVDAIDIHPGSVEEATENFINSPWSERLNCRLDNFIDFALDDYNSGKYDIVVSNPPFFNSGVYSPSTPRLQARHQGELSPTALISHARKLLRPNGKLYMIIPAEQLVEIEEACTHNHLTLLKIVRVKGSYKAKPKRILTEILFPESPSLIAGLPETSTLSLRDESDSYTAEYRTLTSRLYLAF